MSRLPSLGPRGEGWLAAQLTLIAAVGFAPRIDPWRPADAAAGAAIAIVGSLLSTAGVTIGVLAALQLVRSRSFSALRVPPDEGELVESGLYARVRHPVYSGIALGGLGWAVTWISPLALVALGALVVVLYLKAAREEEWLVRRFPTYAAYRERTKRLIPGVL
ncbi:MAG: isoprenylcysteine carboxylmethyltransferase family protein [Chloroflexi bacterium]|nr:isoprenylcysteine carboxylmethyltransferase family protein [Chloroflexota bacterium]